MKKHEIEVGGIYHARISGRFVNVRVDAIRQQGRQTVYSVTWGGPGSHHLPGPTLVPIRPN